MTPDDEVLLRTLLTRERILSLAVLVEGEPVLGLLPFALQPDAGALLVHASSLARHTRGLAAGGPYAALIHAPEMPGGDPQQIPRVTLSGAAVPIPRESPAYAEARAVYLARLPSSAALFELADFGLYALTIARARFVAGFARAFTLTPARIREIAASA